LYPEKGKSQIIVNAQN